MRQCVQLVKFLGCQYGRVRKHRLYLSVCDRRVGLSSRSAKKHPSLSQSRVVVQRVADHFECNFDRYRSLHLMSRVDLLERLSDSGIANNVSYDFLDFLAADHLHRHDVGYHEISLDVAEQHGPGRGEAKICYVRRLDVGRFVGTDDYNWNHGIHPVATDIIPGQTEFQSIRGGEFGCYSLRGYHPRYSLSVEHRTFLLHLVQDDTYPKVNEARDREQQPQNQYGKNAIFSFLETVFIDGRAVVHQRVSRRLHRSLDIEISTNDPTDPHAMRHFAAGDDISRVLLRLPVSEIEAYRQDRSYALTER